MAQFRSLADLANTTQDELLPGIINGLKQKDEFTSVLIGNAAVTDRPTIKGNRKVTDVTAGYVGCDDSITPSALSAVPFSYDLETFGASFDACIKGQNLYSSFTDVVMSELDSALQSISYLIADDAMNGTGSGEIAGFETQVASTVAQAVTGAGNFDLSDLDALMDLVRTSGPKVFVGAPATVNVVIKELRAAAGGTDTVQVQGTDLLRPSFYNIPLLKNQNVASGELHLIDLDQFKLFVGESADANVGGIFSMVPVGVLETKLRKRWHTYINAATVLLDQQGGASLTGVA